MIEATTSSYWIASDALYISLNANDDPDYIMGNAAANAYILCYIKDVDGLDYDAGHNYRRWPLSLSPTYFSTPSEKYVYVAIPRPNTINTQAVVVFPSEKLDIYGKNINEEQVGSEEYYYIWLQGIITATNAGHTLNREWNSEHHINTGTLSSDEAIAASSEQPWFRYSSVDDTVTFLKKILMDARSSFLNLILGNKNLTGVATSETEYTDSDTLVATPSYISSQYLSKTNDDTAEGNITFKKGVRVVGSSGGTTPDTDNVTQKNLGLEVSESGVIGGILRVAQSLLTKTIQSLNFSGSDSLTGTGWQLTDDYGTGRSRLIVDDAVFRGKVTMNELEVRKLTAMGGNYVFSPAASIIEQVDYYDGDGRLLGYTRIKVPWVLRLIPLSLFGRYLSRYKWVRSTITAEDLAQVKFYRCWLKADDGSTQTINTWRAGMLARCQTFDTSQVENGTHGGTYSDADVSWGKNVTNKLYWRAVVAVADGVDKEHYEGQTIALEDGRKHNFIDIANYTDDDNVQLFLTGSDHVSAGDHIVCFGDWKDRQLANLVTIETIGSDAPAVKEFVGVGYTDGTSIDWNLDGKMRTRISPTAGNKFVAPEFIIETTGEKLGLKPRSSANVLGFYPEQHPVVNPQDGDTLLLHYTDYASEDVYMEYDATEGTWNDDRFVLGTTVVNKHDGHIYEVTSTGWRDLGLMDEARSSLKVDIDGVSAEVGNKISKTTTLQTAEQIVQTAESNANGYTDSQITQTATAIRSEVKGSGNNILNGVQTYTGNTHLNHTSAAADGHVEYESTIYSLYTLQAGKWYTFQCKTNGTFASGHSSSDSQGKCTIWLRFNGTSGYNGEAFGSANLTGRLDDEAYYWTFQCQQTGVYWLRTNTYSDGTTEVSVDFWDIMLENGKVANGWVAPTQGMLSYISQTANNIQAVVENKLGQTGVKIDGNNREIDLIAGKVKFRNNTDTADNQYMSIGSDGKLTVDSIVATNGTFSGTVEATTLKGKVTSTGLEIYDGNNNLRVTIKPQSISSAVFGAILKMFIGYDGLTIGKSNGTHATFADSGFEFLFPPYEDNENTYISPIGGLKFSTMGVQVPYQYPSGSLVPSTFVNYNGFQSGIKVLTEEDFGEPTTIRYSKTDAEYNVYVYTAQAEDTTLIFRLNGASKTYFVCLGDGAGGNTNVDNNTLFPKVGRKIRVLNASYQGWTSQRDLYVVGGRNIAMNNGGNSADGRIKIPVGTMWEFTYLDTYSPAFMDGNPYRAWLCVEIKRNS